ncbi:MAG: hypothetical protein ACXVXP_00355 [Mycobacteriaceae bacterium]
MFATKVDLSRVVAYTLWVVTFLFILSGTLVAVATDDLGVALVLVGHGLACSAAAATATIRDLMFQQNRLLSEFFELGREAAGVRQMHTRP